MNGVTYTHAHTHTHTLAHILTKVYMHTFLVILDDLSLSRRLYLTMTECLQLLLTRTSPRTDLPTSFLVS